MPDYYGRSAYKDINILDLPVFGELARDAVSEGRTLLYYDKLYTVFQAIFNISRLRGPDSDITIADIGAYKGGGAYFMAACAEALGFRRVALHVFDTFVGQHEEDIRPEFEVSQEQGRKLGRYRDVSADDVRAYLSRFPGAVVHAGRVQDTAKDIQPAKIDFAHVDINLQGPTAFALSFLHEQLVDGGIIIVDDYGSTTNPGVHAAVNEFLEANHDYVRFHHLTNQCVLIRHRPPPAHP